MPKPQPADFYTPIERITEHNLLHRLLIGIEKFKSTREEKDKEIEKLPSAVREFMISVDHGIEHSRQVLERAAEILSQCPNLLRHSSLADIRPRDIKALLTWAALLHDFTRFLGYNLKGHQLASAQLALACFISSKQESATELYAMIRRHDYLSPIIDGENLPELFLNHPLAEVFRLVDKTSLPPVKEIERYYLAGKNWGNVFFKPELTYEERFDYSRGTKHWDQINHFLNLFAIQASDWAYDETRRLYRQWEMKDGGRLLAVKKIFQLAEQEGLSSAQSKQINDILEEFFKRFNLLFYYNALDL